MAFSARLALGRDRPESSQWPDGKLLESKCRAVIGQKVFGGLKVAFSASSPWP